MAEPDSNLKEIEALKVELLAAQQTINKLQMRSDDVKAERDKLNTKIHDLERHAQKSKDELEDVISLLKSDVATLTKKKIELEGELSQKGIELAEHQMASKAKVERLIADWESERNASSERYKSLEEKYNLIVDFEEEKIELEGKIVTLEAQVKKEIADRLRAVADKEREKVELVEKLKKEMEQRIHDTKTTMLALKKEQLDAASRLAVVQNHQLTTELEYQNRQVEKIVSKMNKLEEENISLKRDVQIHKEVETEMAKKTTKAQSVIKKLNERLKDLEVQIDIKNEEKKNVKEIPESNGKKDDIIKFLQESLDSTEKKLAKLQNDYGILLRDFDNIERRLTRERERYADAATLVRETLETIVEEGKSFNGSESANMLAIDLDEIKGKSIAELDQMQKQLLLNVILEQIKTHLNERNLTNEFYPVLKGRAQSQSYGVLVVDKKAYQLPNIHEKSLASKINKSKFDHSPRSVKSKLLKGDLREWGVSMPEMSPIGLKDKIKYKV